MFKRWTKVLRAWNEGEWLINDRIFIFGWTTPSKAVHIKNDNYNVNNKYFSFKNRSCKRIADCSPHHNCNDYDTVEQHRWHHFQKDLFQLMRYKNNDPSEFTGLWSIESGRRQNCSVAKSVLFPRNWATITCCSGLFCISVVSTSFSIFT